jgi:hypothetical protein
MTGRAVSNLFDGDKDLDGLKLKGIDKKATIGFLSTMEKYNNCEVLFF